MLQDGFLIEDFSHGIYDKFLLMLSGGVSSFSNYFVSLIIFCMQTVGRLQMLTPGSHLVFSYSGPVDQKKLFCLHSS